MFKTKLEYRQIKFGYNTKIGVYTDLSADIPELGITERNKNRKNDENR